MTNLLEKKCVFCFEEICKCQKIINEYNKNRNIEITQQHLDNIKKLKHKDCINKEKLNYILNNIVMTNINEIPPSKYDRGYIHGMIKVVDILLKFIELGELN